MRRILAGLFLVLALFAPIGSPAAAQDALWLDAPLASWNEAGMAVPQAAAIDGNTDPRCTQRDRPPETEEDGTLVTAGWRLLGSYERGWGVTVVAAFSASDGMCRPLGYQWFVFVDGVFAGTIAPRPMDSRTDGAGNDVNLWFVDQLAAEFVRYTENDPLCCPSGGTVTVEYRIDQTVDGPVLVPVGMY